MTLDEEPTAELLADAAQHLAQADVLLSVAGALKFGRLTALAKPDGRVRGNVTGETLCRLIVRTLAQTYAEDFEAATAPF